jgi:hypothetical protein
VPWRGPSYPGEFPSLGWSIGEWIESYCVIPDGDYMGQPYLLTDEMWTFLAWHYRLRPEATQDEWQAAWAFRRSQLVRPQKWGKGPLTAAMTCAEAVADVRFAGWDAAGEPVGRPWATPWIQITATSEDQTDNIWRALQPMIEQGPLADWIPDTGATRINVPGGGLIEPVTNSGRARLGQRITFAPQDETHCWLEANGGWRLATTQRRNLSGTGGRACETTNGWDPSEQSVAQRTSEAKAKDIHRDHRIPPRPSLANKAERRRSLRIAYGDSMTARPGSPVKPWVNIDRIDAEAVEIAEKDPGQAIRYYWNIPDAGAGSWIDGEKWDARKKPRTVEPGTAVVGALDGSDVDDWTCIRLETEDGYQFTPTYGPDKLPCIWNPAEHGGQVPRLEVLAAIDEIMATYKVVRFYIDPPYWETEADELAAKYGDKRVLRWETYRAVQMHAACERMVTDVVKADSTFHHDGDQVIAVHVRNTRKAARPAQRYVLKKASPTQKIDGCVTSVICHEAAGDVTAAKLWPSKIRRQVMVRR